MVTTAPSIASRSSNLPGDGYDLVSLICHFHLAQHQPLARGKGRDHVDGRLVALLVVGSAQRLAINGDHLGCDAGDRCHPGDETALERLSVQSGQDVAKMIVSWRAVGEWPEAAQQVALFLTKPGDVSNRLGSGQHREQAQQQNLVQRVGHLAALAWVGKVIEMTQEYNCLIQGVVALEQRKWNCRYGCPSMVW